MVPIFQKKQVEQQVMLWLDARARISARVYEFQIMCSFNYANVDGANSVSFPREFKSQLVPFNATQ